MSGLSNSIFNLLFIPLSSKKLPLLLPEGLFAFLRKTGALEHADRSDLLLEGILPTVLGVPPAPASQRLFAKVDEFGHAFAAGAPQEICRHAPLSSGWNLALDQATALQWSRGGMNNKIKSISHRSLGFRSAQYFIAAIYHCCARLPLPSEC
jgi:hypothetical protein